jgi:sRNA-binding regulator protein Hfq
MNMKTNTLTLKNDNNRSGKSQSSPRRSEGHELPLSSMVKHKKSVQMELVSGERVHGVMHSFDRWSITLLINDTPNTYFKHALASFREG